MASSSCKPGGNSSGIGRALAVALLVVCASTGAHAQIPSDIVSVTFKNQVAQSLNVTVGAPPSGMPASIALAPGGTGALSLNVLAPIPVREVLQFRVTEPLYIDMASGKNGALGRFLAETGSLSIVVSAGPCAGGLDGLTLMAYAAGVLINDAGCAVRQ